VPPEPDHTTTTKHAVTCDRCGVVGYAREKARVATKLRQHLKLARCHEYDELPAYLKTLSRAASLRQSVESSKAYIKTHLLFPEISDRTALLHILAILEETPPPETVAESGPPRSASTTNRPNRSLALPEDIRDWALDNGHDVRASGPLPHEIIRLYHEQFDG
jgi:hypothetical protein